MALVASVSAALYQANGDGAETTHRGHQLSMTSTVLIRCIRLLPCCESRLKSRLRHVAQAGKSRTRRSGRPDSATDFNCPQSLFTRPNQVDECPTCGINVLTLTSAYFFFNTLSLGRFL